MVTRRSFSTAGGPRRSTCSAIAPATGASMSHGPIVSTIDVAKPKGLMPTCWLTIPAPKVQDRLGGAPPARVVSWPHPAGQECGLHPGRTSQTSPVADPASGRQVLGRLRPRCLSPRGRRSSGRLSGRLERTRTPNAGCAASGTSASTGHLSSGAGTSSVCCGPTYGTTTRTALTEGSGWTLLPATRSQQLPGCPLFVVVTFSEGSSTSTSGLPSG